VGYRRAEDHIAGFGVTEIDLVPIDRRGWRCAEELAGVLEIAAQDGNAVGLRGAEVEGKGGAGVGGDVGGDAFIAEVEGEEFGRVGGGCGGEVDENVRVASHRVRVY
jgi:hypothetical protein